MSATVRQRLDRVLDHIQELGARPAQIVLSEPDRAELSAGGGDYRGVPVRTGQIGGDSYVEATGAPSGETNFAI